MCQWSSSNIVVFIIKSPHLAYSVDNRLHSTSASTSAVLTIGTIGHRNNRLNVTSVYLRDACIRLLFINCIYIYIYIYIYIIYIYILAVCLSSVSLSLILSP